ncbi:uncharacterized protein LOC114518752 [Dendronephthya gigantea]|uniref:uncharacterized protein LOC114518752 n=1 Tax=Dendronephthya gigantea TaxID=151771 RepID=UPI00106CB003|nr:uncharacterized protein LOC114518752 [Dendronephthya gigantea]
MERAGLIQPNVNNDITDSVSQANDISKGSEITNNPDEDLPKTCDSEYAPSVHSSKRTLTSLLTIEEEHLFTKTFSKLLHSSKPVVMKKVIETLQKTPGLSHLLETFTHRQLADRVRSERKAIVRTKQKKKLKSKAKK